MKNFVTTGLIGVVMFWACVLQADDAPYIPTAKSSVVGRIGEIVSTNHSAGVIAGTATAYNSAYLTDANLAPLVYFTRNQAPHLLNHWKGDLGEGLMNDLFASAFLERTGQWGVLTPTSVGRNGIDGLYIKMDAVGNPRDLLVADAKVNSARLNPSTRTGRQMSHEWCRPRLRRTADSYQKLAADLKTVKVVRAPRLQSTDSTPRTLVPINDKTFAEVWKTKDGFAFFSRDKNLTAAQIQRQASRTSQYLRGAADGKIDFRSRLFTYKAEHGQHVISVKTLDTNGNVVKTTQMVRGAFKDLPKEVQRAIRHTAIRTLGSQKNAMGMPRYSQDELKALVRECENNPEKFNQLCVNPKTTPAWVRAGVTVVSTAVLVGALDAVSQYVAAGEVDWGRVGGMTLLAGSSTALGLATMTGVQMFANGPLATAAGNAAGGAVAAIGLAYGMYAMGYCTLAEANWMSATGAAGAAAIAATPVVLTAIAMHFGTTSAGVAISSLHGIAAFNAAMAWLGGGSLAAGGAGMAGGAVVLTGVTAGVAAVIMAIPIAWQTCKYFKDVKAQNVYLSETINFTQDRVKRGDQQEWKSLQPVH